MPSTSDTLSDRPRSDGRGGGKEEEEEPRDVKTQVKPHLRISNIVGTTECTLRPLTLYALSTLPPSFSLSISLSLCLSLLVSLRIRARYTAMEPAEN